MSNKEELSIKAFYEIEKYIARKIIFSDNPMETYLSYVRAFHKIGSTRKDWQTESIDAIVDGWINNSPEIRELLGKHKHNTRFNHIGAAYVHGIDYILREGNWSSDWISFAKELDKNVPEEE